jgi:hypothetical protein
VHHHGARITERGSPAIAAKLTEIKAEEGSDSECVHDACQTGTVVRYCERRWVIAHLDCTLRSSLGKIEEQQREGFFAFQPLSDAWSRRTRDTKMNLGQSHTNSHESARAKTHLHDGWLIFVCMAWVLMLALAVGRFIASIPFSAEIHPIQQFLLLCTSDSLRDTRLRRPEPWLLAAATPNCALSR